MKAPSYRQAVFELIFAGAIWGYGFIATKYALEGMGPITMTVLRFSLSCIVMLPLLLLIPAFRSKKHKFLFLSSVWPGLTLSLLMVFQTWGMVYTTATKSGFITTLYIVLVPIIEVAFLKRRLNREHVFWVFLALFGTALICDFQGGNWNIGDLLTFLCAVSAALHIILLAKISPKVDSPVAFNAYQSFWGAIFAVVALPFFPEQQLSFQGNALFGLLFLAFMSTTVAFMLQIRAQQVLSASIASLLFLLESPFAALFGFVFLHEVLSVHQWLGALLILVAALMTVRQGNDSSKRFES